MAGIVNRCSRVIVLNPVATYGRGERQTRLPGFVELAQPGELKEYLRGRLGSGFRVLYSPRSDVHEHFEAVCKLVLAARDCVFAVDEIWYFQKSAWSPRDLNTMMLTGRHYGVTLVWTAQRPQKTDSTLRSVTTELYIGSLPSLLDQSAFHGLVPDPALVAAARLPARSFVHRFPDFSWEIEEN